MLRPGRRSCARPPRTSSATAGTRRAPSTSWRMRAPSCTSSTGRAARTSRPSTSPPSWPAAAWTPWCPPIADGKADSKDYTSNTVITVFNGAEEAMPETFARLKRVFKDKGAEVVLEEDADQAAELRGRRRRQTEGVQALTAATSRLRPGARYGRERGGPGQRRPRSPVRGRPSTTARRRASASPGSASDRPRTAGEVGVASSAARDRPDLATSDGAMVDRGRLARPGHRCRTGRPRRRCTHYEIDAADIALQAHFAASKVDDAGARDALQDVRVDARRDQATAAHHEEVLCAALRHLAVVGQDDGLLVTVEDGLRLGEGGVDIGAHDLRP